MSNGYEMFLKCGSSVQSWHFRCPKNLQRWCCLQLSNSSKTTNFQSRKTLKNADFRGCEYLWRSGKCLFSPSLGGQMTWSHQRCQLHQTFWTFLAMKEEKVRSGKISSLQVPYFFRTLFTCSKSYVKTIEKTLWTRLDIYRSITASMNIKVILSIIENNRWLTDMRCF